MRYLARRLVLYALAAWASLTLSFALPRLMPGDPASATFARFQGKLSPEAMDALATSFGVSDDPLWRQYIDYLGGVVTGEFGTSVSQYPAPVADIIGSALVWTLVLTGVAVILSFALGTALGVIAAWRRGGWFDSLAPPAVVFLGAFPYFWLAMLALFVFGFTLEWSPLRHAYASHVSPGFSWSFLSSVIAHAVLPAATIVIASLGGWLLSMRNTMVGVLSEAYVTLAHAKGLPDRTVMWRYAARNAILPNVTGFGMALGFVLSGSLLTEIIFSYPGLGYVLIQAVRGLDYPLLQGLFLTLTIAVLAANLLVDLVVMALDPRVRNGGKS